MDAHDIEAHALRLPRDARARLARHLLASLDDADDGIEQAWAEEAARRDRALRDGDAEPVPADEVFAAARHAAR